MHPAELRIAKDDANNKLQERISLGLILKEQRIGSPKQLDDANNEYYSWNTHNEDLLRRIFSTSQYSDEYQQSCLPLRLSVAPPSFERQVLEYYKNLNDKILKLGTISDRLDLVVETTNTASKGPSLQSQHSGGTKKVFIVHGHDDAAKASLESFLREIGLDPIVLHKQADEGLTVIEKFEKHSDVGYAFILLTPDEIAYLNTGDNGADADIKKERRARPNVIFEFGYFVGKLGRSRVCCLHTGGVSLPSDVNGMIYKSFSKSIGEVAYDIIKDLKVAGYKINY